MHDLKQIRANPDAFEKAMQKRGLTGVAAKVLELDETARGVITETQNLQTRRNELSKEIGQKKSKGENADDLMQEVTSMKERLATLEGEQRDAEAAVENYLAELPNIFFDDVPVGKDENDNKLLAEYGTIPKFNFTPKEHFDLGEALGLMDFERAAKMSGARFVILKGALARMERALAQFMLDIHTNEFGYTEIAAPYLVKANALYGTGNLPKFAEDLFATTTDHYLIPTSEVSMTNIHADEILMESELPKRFAGFTPCFRSEAGSAGRDTRGMIRQHQFHKVELVGVTHPDFSDEEQQRMVKASATVLERLKLPFRHVMLCTGDTGFASRRTIDTEVWLPGQDRYREIASCSNCGDFQARRMKTRFRKDEQSPTQFVHTLNGSGVATGRCLIAVMENYQDAKGRIHIPEALQPYMGGMKIIGHE